MIHLPIVENRIAQFAAKFEPVGDGRWAWFGDNASGGLPVSDAERRALIDSHTQTLKRCNRFAYLWLVLAVVGLATFEISQAIDLPRWQEGLFFVAPLPLVFWRVWRAERAPFELAGRRVPIAPPRSYSAGVRSRLAALPPSVSWTMIAIGALLIVQLARYGHLASDPAGLGLGAFVMVFGAWIIVVRRRAQAR